MSKSPKDYRNPVELVVGGSPSSQPTSPSSRPPVAAQMLPPEQKSSSLLPVESVFNTNQQPLLGERRSSMSRFTLDCFAYAKASARTLAVETAPTVHEVAKDSLGSVPMGAHESSPGLSASVPDASQNAYCIPSHRRCSRSTKPRSPHHTCNHHMLCRHHRRLFDLRALLCVQSRYFVFYSCYRIFLL